MAKRVLMRHQPSGIEKYGFYGYSWTTLFFGAIPALFRGDVFTFLGFFAFTLMVGLFTLGIGAFLGMFLWSFFYNGYYTRRLLEKGYVFCDADDVNQAAAAKLRITLPSKNIQAERRLDITAPKAHQSQNEGPASKVLSEDVYRLFLVEKYDIRHNSVLGKYVCGGKVFDSVDLALVYAHSKELENESLREIAIEESLARELNIAKYYYNARDSNASNYAMAKGILTALSEKGSVEAKEMLLKI